MSKKAFLPPWIEAIIVIVLLVMAVVEWNNGERFFAAVFGIVGVVVGISLIAQKTGDKDGEA